MGRLVSLVLAAALCLGLLAGVPAWAVETPTVGYTVSGALDGRTLNVTIAVRGLQAQCGRLGLDYDETKLELPEGDSLTAIVKGASGAVISNESYGFENYVSRTSGRVLFGWFPNAYEDVQYLDAVETAVPLASIAFTLKDGVEAEDLDGDTLKLWYTSSVSGAWDSAAWLRSWMLTDYKNGCAGMPDCGVTFDYPGCDKAPASGRPITLTLKDTGNAPLAGGVIVVGTRYYETDAQGQVRVTLADGRYNCRAWAEGYGECVVQLPVNGSAVEGIIKLTSSETLVEAAAELVQIVYAAGDSAERVTQDIGLPTKGAYNTKVSWTSSAPQSLSGMGHVLRLSQPVAVTLTATVSKDGHEAVRTFQVTVAEKDAEPEPPQPEEPDPPEEPNPPEQPELPVQPEQPSEPGVLQPSEDFTGFGEGSVQPPDRPEQSFYDLVGYDWASEQIETMAELGVIAGVGGGQFAPGSNIKRGDFVLMLMRLLKPETTAAGADFADVPRDSYWYAQIGAARALGITQGGANNDFRPGASITREDMIVLTIRALEATGYLRLSGKQAELGGFQDADRVSGYARTHMAQAVADGLIVGIGSGLGPKNATTRAEAAVFLYRVYQSASRS